MAQHDEYRFAAIEKRLDKVDQVHEIVTRLDERFDKIDTLYDNRTSALEKSTEAHQKDIEDLKTFKWKAMGTVGLIMVLVSVFGTAIGNAIVKKFVTPATTTQTSYLIDTNASGYFQAKDKESTTIKGSSKSSPTSDKLHH